MTASATTFSDRSVFDENFDIKASTKSSRVNQRDQSRSGSPKRRRIGRDFNEQDRFNASAPVRENHIDDQGTSHRGVPGHPLQIKPLGNSYTGADSNIKSSAGLLAYLPDDLLLQLLEYLSATDLIILEATCRVLYAFCRHDEIWRTLFVDLSPISFRWQGTWRATYLKQKSSNAELVNCTGLYSDALYRPFYCAHVSLDTYTQNVPMNNEIPRLDDMAHSQFTDDGWADRPFILTQPVKQWSAYHNWSTARLLQHHADTKFRAENVDWPLRVYVEYMRNNSDESPLYLFDSHFDTKMFVENGISSDSTTLPDLDPEPAYTSPATFGSDLFALLGSRKPNNKWLILGPARSGSTFHKDPNGTSAWNAVLRGSKYWLMFPSSTATGKPLPPPPGVFLSADASEVTSPLSIAEYLLSFHAIARATSGCREGICRQGEVLHVPSGWFHLVLNLEESLAITQNFVPEAHLLKVLEFLRDTPEQISGFASDIKSEDVYEMFIKSLQQGAPELLDKVSTKAKGSLYSKFSGWEDLTSNQDVEAFSFGFGDADEGADIP